MVTIGSDLMQSWVLGLMLPLTRILALIAMAPILGHPSIPKRVKLGLGVILTLMLMPTLPTMPAIDLLSLQGLLVLVQQMMIGLAIGFSMRLVFSAVEVTGQLISMTMGLGFASFFDPQTRAQSTAISQFLVILALLIFLSLDGHLIFVTAISQSFYVIPVSLDSLNMDFMKIALWGEIVFSAGLLLAMPVIAALLVTNMALGILTRTAPQLNLFGIGFPITISVGFVVLALSLSSMVNPIEHLIAVSADRMLQITK